MTTVTLGGGCFWCLEAVYEILDGVEDVVSGYAGGKTTDPDYKSVCGGATGHAEVVQITFDESRIALEDVLDIFWKCHDPTTPDRQGADVGSQYRSIILYHDTDQKAVAEKSRSRAGAMYRDPIVTEIVPLETFHRAEDYHQDYFRTNPNAGYCQAVIRPKLAKMGAGRGEDA